MSGTVCGYVVHRETHAPVSGARVLAMRDRGGGFASDGTDELDPDAEAEASTDEYGRFTFERLEEARWLFSVRTSRGELLGHAAVRVFADATSDLTIETLDRSSCDVGSTNGKQEAPIKMRPYGSIRGKVVHAESGEPVQDAAVFVLDAAGIAPDIAPLTDADGVFSLDSLPAGVWRFGVNGPNGESGDVTAEVRDGVVGEVIIAVQ